ncbi:peptide ABC transporter permease [Aquisalibacillus elongatus]|uniref:Peptide/nickel transport system permease protein n=1 Tax=Aquisalibacillus elongatus TaxID=485577 RepID=A0A3N5BUK5_9BACI|nr:peptide ABC transporter permease [Aquisalibacillus elongatus]RPF51072.1 peptide/nickel transport system permease protein [Aquisalibacillus elongatus]
MKIIKILQNHGLLILGLVLLAFLLFVTFIGPYLPIIDDSLEETVFIRDEEGTPIPPPFEPNTQDYILGSDHEGRDLLSLIVMGAKETLFIIVAITIIRYVMAIPLGYLAHKRFLGTHHILKWLNGFLSYVPTIIMVALLATLPPILFSDYRIYALVFLIAFVEVGRAGESIKVDLDEAASQEFIESGVVAGAKPFRIFRKYLWPFIYGKLIVYAITDIGKVMFLIGQLAFVGIFISQALIQVDAGVFEIRNDSISWPMLFLDAFRDLRMSIWIPFWSAFAMAFTILTFNILSQGVQNIFKRKDSHI